MQPRQFRALRMSLGLPASHIAKELGVHPRTVNVWEKTTPPPLSAKKFIRQKLATMTHNVESEIRKAQKATGSYEIKEYPPNLDPEPYTGMTNLEHDEYVKHLVFWFNLLGIRHHLTTVTDVELKKEDV